MHNLKINTGEPIDVLIIAEGTYPFVRGGVASWIHDMICGLTHLRFGVVFLGASPGTYKKYVYSPLPNNLVFLDIVYLFAGGSKRIACPEPNQAAIEGMCRYHQNMRESYQIPEGLAEPLSNLNDLMVAGSGFDEQQFFRSQASWAYIEDMYRTYNTEPSFVNYFWNIRNMHEPLWSIQTAVAKIPQARLIHTISTGYAGFMAVLLEQQSGSPMLLTEHGIYTKERKIELLQTQMFIEENVLLKENTAMSYQHQLWIRFFSSLSRMTYVTAKRITSLFYGLQKQQIAYGASPEKTEVIPNGIPVAHFSSLRKHYEHAVPKVICFVGRFVRIKDIKTFLRAVKPLSQRIPDIVVLIKIVGEPDKDYLRECENFINLLDITRYIRFVESGGMHEMLDQSSVLVLSSISEGMPLVVLESFAAGVPVIATDVGSCRGLIEGWDEEDKALGQAGAVVSISDSDAIAEAASILLLEPGAWQRASDAAIKRVETYYEQSKMLARYDALYQEYF